MIYHWGFPIYYSCWRSFTTHVGVQLVATQHGKQWEKIKKRGKGKWKNTSQSCSSCSRYWWISQKETVKCEIACKYGPWKLYICRFFFFVDLSLCRVWHFYVLPWIVGDSCDLSWIVCTLFRLISIARYFLKFVSIGFRRRKFEIFRECVSKVDNWKPQAGGHVTGPCRRSIRKQKDFLLSLPTGIVSLPLIAHFLFFQGMFFYAAPK